MEGIIFLFQVILFSKVKFEYLENFIEEEFFVLRFENFNEEFFDFFKGNLNIEERILTFVFLLFFL